MSDTMFSGVSPHIEKLARTLHGNGLAASATDAISLAQSISDVEGTIVSGPYGSEKIPNPHLRQPRKSSGRIDNLHPSEHGPPLSHLNTERKPGRIENVPELREQPAERPKPKNTPAVFLHEPTIDAVSVQEAASQEPKQCEESQEKFDITDDEEAVRRILGEDDYLIYGEPEPVEEPKDEEPVIQPAEEPSEPQAQPAPQQPVQQSRRGRGLSEEETEMTDITKIFNFNNR